MELPVAEGQIVAKKYRVERLLGSGGMGVVAAAVNVDLDQPVAIKFLSPEASGQGEAAERFRREARAAAKIRSEHVVRVLDVGVYERQPYMVMELLEGNDLGRELELRGALPLAEAALYVLQAIDAVAEAHGIGIVHRDLKPSNLFLARRGDGTRFIKVLDFGISKLIGAQPRDAALTRTASLVGSPLYMSPEQMRAPRDVDARTDIWALGAILYESVSGGLPFSGASLPEICVSVLNDSPRSLSAQISEEFDQVIRRCLAKDREQRFRSVAELAAALVKFCPAGAGYVERAERMLLSPTAISAQVPPLRPSASSAPAISEAQGASLAPSAQTKPERPDPTHSAWGNTSGSASRRWRLPIVAVGLLVGVGAAVFIARARQVPEASPNVITELPGQAARAQAAADEATFTEKEAVNVEPVAAPSPSSVASVAPLVTPSASAAPSATASAAVVKATAAPKPHAAAHAPHVVTPKPAPQAPAKSTAGSLISDFGGRR